MHIDGPVEWSGILCLSRPQDRRGGTEFFRHLPTGTDHAPTSLDELQAMGFNRLVLLRPWLWHSAGDQRGT